MKYHLTIFIFLIVFCSCNPKIDLNNYLQGGVWCGYSELSEGEICIEFLEKDAYLKMRIVEIPAAFKKVQISPANKVKTLNDELIENNNLRNNLSIKSQQFWDNKIMD